MVQFCSVLTGAILIAAYFDFVEWSTAGWVILGLLILNGVTAWSNTKAQMAEEAKRPD